MPKQFFAHKNKKIWIATVNYQRLFKELQRISQIVTGKNANKSKFKASGQTGLRTPGKQR